MSSYPQPGDLTEQQQPVFNFSSALPFKKRRFPVIRPPSPPPEETISSPIKNASKNEQESKISENNELKSQQELKIQDGENPSSIDARNASSPGNADMNKASVSAVEKDVSTSNTDLGTPNTENVQSKLQDEKPTVNLKSVADLGNSKFDILSNENSPEFDVPKSCARSQIEGTCGVESSMGPMSVELSLGGKELAVPFTEHEKDEDICNKPDKSDPSLLSMALSDKELARLEKIDSTLNEVASQAITNRSNWDLNTTMDVWEGSLGTNALTDTPAGIFGSRKNDDIQDEKFSLITAGKIDFSLDKGKKILDVSGSNTDDSLGLRLATPHMEPDVRKEHFSLSDSSFATSSTSCLGLQSVQTSASPVKSEPVDENTKRDCNMGNGSNSNVVGLLKLSSVKTELVDNHRVETVLQQSVSPEKLIYSGESVKSEAIHQHNQTACKSDDIGNLSAVDHEDTFELDDDEKLNGPAETTEVGVLIDKGENKRRKEDEEYEDGEVREPIQCPGAEKPVGVEKEMENSEYFMHASRNSQPTGDQDIISPSKFNPPKDSAKKILEETRNDLNGDSLSPYGEINCLQKASEEVLEGGVDEKRAISVNPDELLQNCPAKEISVYKLADVDCGVSIELEDADNNNSTLSKSETSLDGHDCVKDSSNLGNKSRIINLSRASAVTSPSKTESVTKTLLTTQSGKERYSGFDGQAQQWGNNRNLRSSFSNRRRISGRFDSRVDWDSSDHDFASEILYSPSDYRPTRRQLTSDLDTECNGYEIQQDGPSDRRKSKKDEFPSLRRDRENHQIFSLFRNSSPNRQRDKFMRHLSDEIINNPSSYNNPQAIYDELDDGQQQQQQLVRGNRNFSNMQRRKGYSRNNRSKSPARDTPGFYRSGRMRSPDRTRFRDEMVPRRRGSPSYGPRHHPSNDLRRGSPERDFSRSGRRRNEGFDNSREMMGDCDEYMNGPGNSKFNERRGPVRSFRPGFNGDSENLNFRFNLDEGHRPYRFCSDSDGEFGERGNGRMREREFDRRVKQHHNQSLGVSRRIRNVEDHEDGNYRTVERAWHDNDGFSDGREKRRRF
ncbi:glutamate receptor 2.3 [Striga asiatica]|uniref:Glutamate receptor 2.3 n=1 Tax=Striga asiatica TaxID=4170 RepID=A0A5A7R0R9_STRAF|nr:glutamate receptor 2.3 [Striga asiatica]